MIYINMGNYVYNKEIFELIRAFYPGNKIIEVEKFFNKGVFIKISILKTYGITDIYTNGNLRASSKVNLDEININRAKDKTIRLGVKKSLFIALSKITGKNLPWGILTGIRPVKIVRSLIEANISSNEIKHILTKEYMLDGVKSNLLIDIAIKQENYIYPLDKDRYSLYIGIPFCPSRCSYCSFAALPIKAYRPYVKDYIDKLIYEIKSTGHLLDNKELNTIYIGGGTPTSIPLESLDRIINAIYKNFDTKNVKEFTVEAGRPETISIDMLKMLRNHKVNRISINPQTMNEKTLKSIGRNHSIEDITKAYGLAKEAGFETINMDLILGLPGEDVKDMKYTLDQISKFNPENLTIHTLAIKKGSKYGDSGEKTYFKDTSRIEEMMELTKTYCKKNDYKPYYLYRQKQILENLENLGYAKKGHESIYNIAIMEEKESIIGLGMGSTTKLYSPEDESLKRIFNFKDLKSYLERIDDLVDKKIKALEE